MIIREATIIDIPQIQEVRNSVKENKLSNPDLITDLDCEEFLTSRGKGWVYEGDGQIVGFAIVDIKTNNIWALFLRPDYEKKGIGKQLHNIMLEWYFSRTKETAWLSTAPKTRAEAFYRKAGWQDIGIYGKFEIKFEMTYENWLHRIGREE